MSIKVFWEVQTLYIEGFHVLEATGFRIALDKVEQSA